MVVVRADRGDDEALLVVGGLVRVRARVQERAKDAHVARRERQVKRRAPVAVLRARGLIRIAPLGIGPLPQPPEPSRLFCAPLLLLRRPFPPPPIP